MIKLINLLNKVRKSQSFQQKKLNKVIKVLNYWSSFFFKANAILTALVVTVKSTSLSPLLIRIVY